MFYLVDGEYGTLYIIDYNDIAELPVWSNIVDFAWSSYDFNRMSELEKFLKSKGVNCKLTWRTFDN